MAELEAPWNKENGSQVGLCSRAVQTNTDDRINL